MAAEVPVDPHRQDYDWSCGPAALKILLSRYDEHIDEKRLIQLTGSNPTSGTEHAGLINAASALGYHVYSKENASLQEMRFLLQNGDPVLIDFQGNSGGHYAVVTGIADGRVKIQDPRQEGYQHYSLAEPLFDQRWYNITYGDRRRIDRWMMAARP